MAKSKPIEDALERLGRARLEPKSAESLAELRLGLANKSAHVAARAAQIAGEAEVEALTADLVAAFERFLLNPAKSDPQCVAKAAIVEALQKIGACEPAVFLRGVRYVQLEPVWGGRADTASAVRGASAFALVAMGYRDAMTPLAELLADPENRVRAAAARAIATREHDDGVAVLRLKCLLGDDDPEVLSECFNALISLSPAESIEFIARFVDAEVESTREVAALALGSSRRPEALPALRDWFERSSDEGRRRTALLGVAMLKSDEALSFLFALIAEAPGPTARSAIEALGLHRYDDALAERVRAVALDREDADLRQAFAEAFPRER